MPRPAIPGVEEEESKAIQIYRESEDCAQARSRSGVLVHSLDGCGAEVREMVIAEDCKVAARKT